MKNYSDNFENAVTSTIDDRLEHGLFPDIDEFADMEESTIRDFDLTVDDCVNLTDGEARELAAKIFAKKQDSILGAIEGMIESLRDGIIFNAQGQ